MSDADKDVRKIDCHYPLIHKSNWLPYHFIHGFIEYLNEQLNLRIKPTAFKGDIHLSDDEKEIPFLKEIPSLREMESLWLIVSGGKYDFTIKWWDAKRYQQVVDYFKGKIQFVQVGEDKHHHPALNNVIDLRGKTDLRQLIRLMYHAQGVVTPVSLFMHLAAAVETKTRMPKQRPCVVIAGGREPVQWEAYPNHQFIHTIGALPCCETGGCWKSRVKLLNDGSENDKPDKICVDVVNDLPRCMEMITAGEVIRRIEVYFNNRKMKFLKNNAMKNQQSLGKELLPSKKRGLSRLFRLRIKSRSVVAYSGGAQYFPPVKEAETDLLSPAPVRTQSNFAIADENLTTQTALTISEHTMRSIPEYPEKFEGRGIVICGGGIRLFTSAWVCINMLRKHGCALPIQLWYLGEKEMDEQMKAIVQPLQVECVDALELRKTIPSRILNG